MKKLIKAFIATVVGTMLISCGSFETMLDMAKQNVNNQENQEQKQDEQNEENQGQEQASKKATSIKVVHLPNKTLYQLNEDFDSTGMVVEATFDDETHETITDYTLSKVDTSSEGNKTVVIYYENCSYSFSVSVGGKKQMNGIEVRSLPNKTDYYISQPFEREGLSIDATYNDASREPIENYTVDEVDTSLEGIIPVTVRYDRYTATFNINVTVPTLAIECLEIAQYPTKAEYIVGEEFNSEGLIVNIVYEGGFKLSTVDYSLSEVNTSTTGTKEVIISYQSYSVSFNIEVIEITSIRVASSPTKTNYFVGEEFSSDGLVVEAVFSNTRRTTLSSDEYTIDPVDINTAGTKEVVIRYQSFVTSFNINVDNYANFPLFNNANDLLEGDKYVLVYQNTAVAGEIKTQNGYSFLGALTSGTEFNNDGTVIKKLNSAATVFTLVAGSNDGYWKLADENGRYLGTSGTRKLAWNSGVQEWKISFSGDTATIASSTTSYGKLRYNSSVTNNYAGFTTYSTSANVKLYQVAKGEEVYPTDFAYTGLDSTTMKVGDTAQLSLSYTPSNTNKKIISYESSDTTVATISNKGLISAKKAGEATITIKAQKEDETFITKTIGLTVENVAVSSVNFDKTSLEVGLGRTATIAATVLPSNATIKDLTWTSSNTSVATVNNGVITPAAIGQTTITATSVDSGKYATCTVNVVEQQLDAWTILVYLCGSNLESGDKTTSEGADAYGGYATSDLEEILSVSKQPDDVNIVVETGGSKAWASKYGVSNNNQTRYYVKNQKLIQDQILSRANMSAASTLQSFLEYGLENYPAEKTGVILWNHGGAMHGVCNDEYQKNDALLNDEVKSAVSGALNKVGMTGQKLEWIGYDACLMAVQDIAEFNSQYFNYMVSSEESEDGRGWDYDTWIDDLYNKESTETILTAICEGFINAVGKYTDQTLSWLDLSYMADYKTKWEAMSSTIKPLINSYTKSSFQSLMKTVKYYGTGDGVEGYSYFGTFDALDFLNKIAKISEFNSASTQISNCKTAFGNLVKCNKKGTKAGNSNGLCLYFPLLDNSGYCCSSKTYYSASQTNFTNWRSIVTTYGDDYYLS